LQVSMGVLLAGCVGSRVCGVWIHMRWDR